MDKETIHKLGTIAWLGVEVTGLAVAVHAARVMHQANRVIETGSRLTQESRGAITTSLATAGRMIDRFQNW